MMEDTDEYEVIVPGYFMQLTGGYDFTIHSSVRYANIAMNYDFVRLWQYVAFVYIEVDPKSN